ncbi:hypothetical protein K502DRAFT_341211 [Neoconidiobolus thromboides FSU 785]|nr:hypothetical protein K502DRAFT_341211 [Neoconidiobolus thromboides FSU 785]
MGDIEDLEEQLLKEMNEDTIENDNLEPETKTNYDQVEVAKNEEYYEEEIEQETNQDEQGYNDNEEEIQLEQREQPAFQSFDIQLHNKDFWDDSALIAAWDEGVRQRDEMKNNRNSSNQIEIEIESEKIEETNNKGRKATFSKKITGDIETGAKKKVKKNENNKIDNTESQGASTTVPVFPPVSFPVLNGQRSQQDVDLENLLSSWYFAGYYSGLYQVTFLISAFILFNLF